ncbi:MAG: hypothetical protein V7637_3380 [Mycobacteriales bacterium]
MSVTLVGVIGGRSRSRQAVLVALVLASLTVPAGVVRPAPAHADIGGGGGDFVPLSTPHRVLDTRSGTGGVLGAIPSGETRIFPVTGGGVPTAGVSAVLVDVSAVGAAGQTYLSLWANGQQRPGPVSMVVGQPGQAVSNSAMVPVGADGNVAIFNSTATSDAVVDVQGYFTSDSASHPGNGGFIPVGHQRLVDTRSGIGAPQATIGSGKSLTVLLSNTAVPATAAFVNLTVVNAAAPGWLAAFPSGGTAGISVVDFRAGMTTSGAALALGPDGRVTFVNHSAQAVDLLVDSHGYFSSNATAGSGLRPTAARLLDTASSGGDLAPQATVDIPVLGRAGLGIRGVTAVALNLTVVSASAPGFLRLWPAGAPEPSTSLANFPAAASGAARSDQAITYVTGTGAVRVRNVSAGHIHLVVDLEGWFDGNSTSLPVERFAPAAALDTDQHGVAFAYTDNAGTLRTALRPEPATVDGASWQTVSGDDRYTGRPALVELADQRIQLVALRTDGHVETRTQVTPGGPWGPWADLGGPVASPPVVATVADSLVILATDADGALWRRRSPGATGTYNDWLKLDDGGLAGTPQVADPLSHDPYLVGVDRAGTAKLAVLQGDSVSPWVSLGASYANPAGGTGCGTNALVTARRSDGAVATTTSAGGGPLTRLGTLTAAGPPTVAIDGFARAAIVAQSATGGLSWTQAPDCLQASPAWGDWQPLVADPAATSPAAWEYFVNLGGANGTAVLYRSGDAPPALRYLTGPLAP